MAVYVYIQPYRNNHVNILETVILTDILLMLIIASCARFEVSRYILCVHKVYASNVHMYANPRIQCLANLLIMTLIHVEMSM